MELSSLYQTTHCPFCNAKLTFTEEVYWCLNHDYTWGTFSNYLRFSISNSLVCGISNKLLKYSTIYQAKSTSVKDHNNTIYNTTFKKFSESQTFNTIRNAKDINDLKQKFVNLYYSPFK